MSNNLFDETEAVTSQLTSKNFIQYLESSSSTKDDFAVDNSKTQSPQCKFLNDVEEIEKNQSFKQLGELHTAVPAVVSNNSHIPISSASGKQPISSTSSNSSTPSTTPSPRKLMKPQKQQALDLDFIGFSKMDDDTIKNHFKSKGISWHKLEKELEDLERAVKIRRQLVEETAFGHGNLKLENSLAGLPYQHYDYAPIQGACCENVIGYMPIPVGTAGPLLLNNENYFLPMATTEGCLIASTHRGCKAITVSGGCNAYVLRNKMTRGPAVRFPTVRQAVQCVQAIRANPSPTVQKMKEAFQTTTSHGRLESVQATIAGRTVYIRFEAFTSDAMGMNMISKGTKQALNKLQEEFKDMQILAISGNYCTDKKAAAMNWINGRGKHVVCEALITNENVRKILKTNVETIVDVNIQKNLIGSAMAGSIGGFNAHAANIIAAMYIATGQDPAQVVESSSCITLLEAIPRPGTDIQDLLISVNMPCIEVGTLGGGTFLGPQSSCLELINCRGANNGENACQLAKLIAGGVLAGELSLLSALASQNLVTAHMKHNRSKTNLASLTSSNSSSTSSLPRRSVSSSNLGTLQRVNSKLLLNKYASTSRPSSPSSPNSFGGFKTPSSINNM